MSKIKAINSLEYCFPDFKLDITIPEGFQDNHYKNDACPCWFKPLDGADYGLQLWVDYKDPKLSECRDSVTEPRYILQLIDFNVDFSGMDVLLSSNFNEVKRVIKQFSGVTK
jgi:hypothetical protein